MTLPNAASNASLTPATASNGLVRVDIDLGERSYPIHIGAGLLDAGPHWRALAAPKAQAWVITNDVVGPLYAERLVQTLRPLFRDVQVLQLPDGEAHKDAAGLNLIYDALLGTHADRKTVLFALGGGVTGDMTGFAAACYMRGVPFVQVPTTLLAQVDSSVGGKTAINHPLGKNMIGAFYQPQAVVCDLATLDTLVPRELSAGLAEVIKYGAIIDAPFFEWLEAELPRLLARDRDALAYAVQRCCELKAFVVGQDEKEAGLRAILNFGHTFGHAIEAGLGFGVWLHGEAVGCGMVMGARLSVALGLIDASVAERIEALCARAGLPVRGPAGLTPAQYLELMRHDKKADSGDIRYVLLESLGQAAMRAAPDALAAQVIAEWSASA